MKKTLVLFTNAIMLGETNKKVKINIFIDINYARVYNTVRSENITIGDILCIN